MKKSGYREMLRDRCPKAVDYALKWQSAKERWIEHVYRSFIWIFADKEERKKVTRLILCLKYTHVKQGHKKYIQQEEHFDFDKSVDWDNLTEEETAYWKRVSSWVKWFMEKYSIIQKEYETSISNGEDEFTIKVNIINNHLSALLPNKKDNDEESMAKYEYIDRLVDYLIKCFNKGV